MTVDKHMDRRTMDTGLVFPLFFIFFSCTVSTSIFREYCTSTGFAHIMTLSVSNTDIYRFPFSLCFSSLSLLPVFFLAECDTSHLCTIVFVSPHHDQHTPSLTLTQSLLTSSALRGTAIFSTQLAPSSCSNHSFDCSHSTCAVMVLSPWLFYLVLVPETTYLRPSS
ncbi:hypothetical protein F5141DRAFT_361795 [Pisolithus sp. B1]|nr:hypothetical protein F5141DRAFT_361795 [Pisolithus sp. B1]